MKQLLFKSPSDKTYSFIMYLSGLLCCPNGLIAVKIEKYIPSKNQSKSEIENPWPQEK